DWVPAHLAREEADLRLPTALGFAPDLTRRFNSVDALRLKTASTQILVQFTADEALALGPITARNATIGRLTSQTWSESRASAFAIGWLDADAVKVGTKIAVPSPSGQARAEILRPIF